jgi:phosphate acetyltransferase
MRFITELHEKAAALNRKIVLPEANDVRMLRAAKDITDRGIARIVLLGKPDTIHGLAQKEGIHLPHSVQILDPLASPKASEFAAEFYQKRKSKGVTYEESLALIRSPLYFANMLVHRDEADGCVSGAFSTTSDVLRAAIQVVGVRAGSSIVSSFFLMVLPDGRVLTYSDCGVVPYPDSNQLASIAVDAALSHQRLTSEEPVVAFLSFSTLGSAEHERVSLVQAAVEIAREKAPTLAIDGEMQFDAAFVPEVGTRKAPNSPVAGRANVFIFPNLDAGNIAYKITERIGRAAAFGPILQGVARPVNDLSRGCSVEDIVNVVAITAVMAA